MITEPYVWHKDFFDIAENTQTMVEIEPIIFFYDNDTRGVSSELRECVFDVSILPKKFHKIFLYFKFAG